MTIKDKWYAGNNMASETAHPCEFAIGDKVQFTNDQGCVFAPRTVIGFARPGSEVGGRFVYIDSDCPWCPVSPDSLKKIGE